MEINERILLQIDNDRDIRFCVKNNKTYVTDGRIIIEVNKVISEYEKHETFPVEKVITNPNNINKFFDINNISNFLRSKENHRICNVCLGSGRADWHCHGHIDEFECPECEGSGNVESKEIVSINNIFFSIQYLKIIVEIAILAEVEKVNLIRTDAENVNTFIIGDCKVYLMPLRNNSYKKEVLEVSN